jgi:C4-dicarboxylate-specific signal transduction histidine kinase
MVEGFIEALSNRLTQAGRKMAININLEYINTDEGHIKIRKVRVNKVENATSAVSNTDYNRTIYVDSMVR